MESKISKEISDAIREYIDVGEEELAVDGICTGLIDGKIRVSKSLFSRINEAIIDTHKVHPEEAESFKK